MAKPFTFRESSPAREVADDEITKSGSSMRHGFEVVEGYPSPIGRKTDIYISADVETDGPIPGPYSMLSFALVYAGAFDGKTFFRPPNYDRSIYC